MATNDLPTMPEIMAHVPEAIRSRHTEMSFEEYSDKRINDMNSIDGNLTGYDCPICKNKGVIYSHDGIYEVSRECECMKIRRSIWNIEKSGLKNLLDKYTFENYKVTEPWQKVFKESAERFINDHTGKWFYAGGQVGCGKTHICTAIVKELLKQGIPARYMLWRDEVVTLKAVVNDEVEYPKLINPLKTVPVLYIDDFFKTGDELDKFGNLVKKRPTQGDINVAFEILNYRYNNDKLITIISSERTIDELLDCDEAVGSRIYQRTKEYCKVCPQDIKRNFRMR